jgi:hypothetical protein
MEMSVMMQDDGNNNGVGLSGSGTPPVQTPASASAQTQAQLHGQSVLQGYNALTHVESAMRWVVVFFVPRTHRGPAPLTSPCFHGNPSAGPPTLDVLLSVAAAVAAATLRNPTTLQDHHKTRTTTAMKDSTKDTWSTLTLDRSTLRTAPRCHLSYTPGITLPCRRTSSSIRLNTTLRPTGTPITLPRRARSHTTTRVTLRPLRPSLTVLSSRCHRHPSCRLPILDRSHPRRRPRLHRSSHGLISISWHRCRSLEFTLETNQQRRGRRRALRRSKACGTPIRCIRGTITLQERTLSRRRPTSRSVTVKVVTSMRLIQDNISSRGLRNSTLRCNSSSNNPSVNNLRRTIRNNPHRASGRAPHLAPTGPRPTSSSSLRLT